MSDDPIAAGLVDAARRAVDEHQSEPPKPHGDPLASEVPTGADQKDASPFDPGPADTYSTAEAARLLGVSDRRVRQMVSEGQLPGERDDAGVLSIPQQAVHEERARRRKEARTNATAAAKKPDRPAAALDVDVIAAAVEAAVSRVLVGQLELTQRAQSEAANERRVAEQERARRFELEAEVVRLRAQLEVAESAKAERSERQRWWQKRPPG